MLREGDDSLRAGQIVKRKYAGTTEISFLTATLDQSRRKFGNIERLRRASKAK
jgi:hypothetical protein